MDETSSIKTNIIKPGDHSSPTLSPTLARRLAITRQRLAGPRPAADVAGIREVVGDLGCLQLDPTSIVARSHLLVLWSRLGPYDRADLDTLLWHERAFFEYWAHAAAIVLTEDYPIHELTMRQHGTGNSAWSQRMREWVATNQALHDYILTELQQRGPLLTSQFEDQSRMGWRSSGWTEGRNVNRMLDFLWTRGQVLVAGRPGQQRLWDLAERCLPSWTPREVLTEDEVVYRAAQKSLRALGVARPKDIAQHYIRGRYPGLNKILAELEAEGQIVQVRIEDWRGPWYIHTEDLPLLDRLIAGDWEPRTTLLSPFDNLICDRARTEQLFDFHFRIEIYVPKPQRKYGYFVLPILHGDRLIGRIDPALDRKRQVLTIQAVYAEPDAPLTKETGLAIARAVQELAVFVGAKDIVYTGQVPEGWRPGLAS